MILFILVVFYGGILQMSVVEGTTMCVVFWDLIPSHMSSQWFGHLECRERIWMGIAMDVSQLRAFMLW